MTAQPLEGIPVTYRGGDLGTRLVLMPPPLAAPLFNWPLEMIHAYPSGRTFWFRCQCAAYRNADDAPAGTRWCDEHADLAALKP